MGFPAVHWGSFGEEKTASSTKINGFPLGIKMVMPDGREFVHARAGGTALVAGKLYQAATSVISLADTMYAKSLVCSTTAVGATTVTITTGGTTAVTLNAFADGFLATAGTVGTGIGLNYKIKSNNSAASGSTSCAITLYETDAIKVALEGGTTKVGVIENKYNGVELSVASTVGAPNLGVAACSAAASSYVWLQTKGEASVFVGGTVLLQRSPCVCSTAVAGAVVPIVVAATSALLDTKESFDVIGIGLTNSATAGFSVVDLRLS
jgi:hypothetical protein